MFQFTSLVDLKPENVQEAIEQVQPYCPRCPAAVFAPMVVLDKQEA